MATLTPDITVQPDTTESTFSTVSLLQPTSFKLTIDRKHFKNIEFFAQSVLHPSLSLSAVEVAAQRVASIPMPGDKLTFGELTSIVIVDEDLNGYTEMYNWMRRLIQTKQTNPLDREANKPPSAADITVSILSSHNNQTRRIRYYDCIPTLLGDISFEATSGEVEYLTFPIAFRFSYFEVV